MAGVISGSVRGDRVEAAGKDRRPFGSCFRDPCSPGAAPRLWDHRIVSAVSYVRANYCEPKLTLERLGRVAALSRQHLGHLFREMTGVPFRPFLRDLRMKAAAAALTGSPAIIKQISSDVGYSSVTNFTRDFRRAYGVAPRRFRELHAAEAPNALTASPPTKEGVACASSGEG
jgi:AraC-like DNA-binding protein